MEIYQENIINILIYDHEQIRYTVLLNYDSNQERIFVPNGVNFIAKGAFGNNP